VLAQFDSVVLTALKETEQALAEYSAALGRRQALADAQGNIITPSTSHMKSTWPGP